MGVSGNPGVPSNERLTVVVTGALTCAARFAWSTIVTGVGLPTSKVRVVTYGPAAIGNAGLVKNIGNDAGNETKPLPVVAGSGPLSKVHAIPCTRKSRRSMRFPARSNVAVARAGAATRGGQTLAIACVMLRTSVGLPQFFHGIGTASAGAESAAASTRQQAKDTQRMAGRN